MRSLVLLLLPLLLLTTTFSTSDADAISPVGSPEVPAGWELIEHVEDPFYWQVGNFAAVVYSLWNDIKPVLALDHIVSGCTQRASDGGVDYLLVLQVRDHGMYKALVWGVPAADSQNWKLMSFEPAKDENLHI